MILIETSSLRPRLILSLLMPFQFKSQMTVVFKRAHRLVIERSAYPVYVFCKGFA